MKIYLRGFVAFILLILSAIFIIYGEGHDTIETVLIILAAFVVGGAIFEPNKD